MAQHRVHRQRVASRAEAADHADRDPCNVALVPELLARVHIREVQLDRRDLGRADGVHQGQRGVGVGTGVEDQAVEPAARPVDRVD